MLAIVFAQFDWSTVWFILGFFVLYALGVLAWDALKRFRTRGWVAAVATVSTVTMETMMAAKSPDYTRLTVTYTYTADAGQTGSYKFSKDVRRQAESLAESLPGTEFTIRYNPKNQAESVVLLTDRPD